MNVRPSTPSITVSSIRLSDGAVRVTVTVTYPDSYVTYNLYQSITPGSGNNGGDLYTGPFVDNKDGNGTNNTTRGVFVLDIPRQQSQKTYNYSVSATCPGGIESDRSALSSKIDIPCLPRGTQILTPAGYRLVEELSTGDLVQTDDGRAVPVSMYRYVVPESDAKSAPARIEARAFGEYPVASIRISPWHAFKIGSGNEWLLPKDVLGAPGVTQEPFGESVEYYHIELPDYLTDNLVIDGGAVVESYGIPWKKTAGFWGKATYVPSETGKHMVRRSLEEFQHC